MRRSFILSALSLSSLLLVAAPARAQDKAEDARSDHAQVVGHVGVGYFGEFDVPMGIPAGNADDAATVPAQLIGIRYWLLEKLALDLGFGVGLRSGSTVTPTATGNQTQDHPSTLTLAFKVGLPIALFAAKHYTFFVEPEVLYGHAGQTIKQPPGSTNADTTLAGHNFSIGGRAGAEIHFGFIGLPQVTLDATIGMHLAFTGGSVKQQSNLPGAQPGDTQETTYSSVALDTLSYHQPWNIFISNVAAIYYF